MVIWTTGMSGAGKTTLNKALFAELKPHVPHMVLIDGDQIRAAFGHDLGHEEKDRIVQIKRIQNIAKILSDQGLVVLVGALYCNSDLMAWNRENFQEYFEIYLNVSLNTLKTRDTKGLYAMAERGDMHNVVGIDIPWQAPLAPDLIINADLPETPEMMVKKIIDCVPYFSRIVGSL